MLTAWCPNILTIFQRAVHTAVDINILYIIDIKIDMDIYAFVSKPYEIKRELLNDARC